MRPVFTKQDFIESVFSAVTSNNGNKISELHAQMCNERVQELLDIIDGQERMLKKQGEILDQALRELRELKK